VLRSLVSSLFIAVFATCVNGSELNNPPPLLDPKPLIWGPVAFVPSFDYNLNYSDNATRSDKHPRGDLLNEYLPAMDMRVNPHELLSLHASYEFGWHDYVNNEVHDYLSHRANFELRLKNFKREGLSLVFTDSYRQTGNSDPLENEIPSFQRFQNNNTSARAEYEADRFSISGRVYYQFMDYFSRKFEVSGYQILAGEVQGEYRLKPTHITIFGNLAEARILHPVSDRGDYESHTILIGAKGVYSKLDYSLAIGYAVADFLHQRGSESGPSLLGLIRYTYSPRLDFTLQASRRFQPAANGGLTTETNANFTTRLKLADRGWMLLGLTRNESDRTHDGRLVSTEESIAYEHYLTRFASIRAGYAHIDRDTTHGLPQFRINEARLGFHFSW